MIFTFKRCIGVEVLHGWLIDPRTCGSCKVIVRIAQIVQSNAFVHIDDGDGYGSAQWQVMPAADLLEVRDGDAIVWQARAAT